MHVGQLGVVAGLEQQAGAGAVDDLGQSAGAGDDERRAAGQPSRATMPNGSYSDGMTTHPARWTSVAQLVVGQEAGQVDDVADALQVDLRLQLGQVAAAAGDDAADPGHAVAQQRAIARASTWKPFSYCTRPHVNTSGSRLPGASPVDHHVGSMPLGMRWVLSAGSSKPSTTSRTMNRE